MKSRCCRRSFAIILLSVATSFLFLAPHSLQLSAGNQKKLPESTKDKSSKVADPKAIPADARLAPPKTLDGYFPFTPYKSRADWDSRAEQLRRQLLVAVGLWPMPERTCTARWTAMNTPSRR
jgi:hypothetical protein